jgi:hypothetical protein
MGLFRPSRKYPVPQIPVPQIPKCQSRLATNLSILFKDDPPSGRFGLVAMEHADGTYYAFKR